MHLYAWICVSELPYYYYFIMHAISGALITVCKTRKRLVGI